jgi:hypothetical protein
MAKGEIKGHIDCPVCGTAGGMRITPDRNGQPFGFCEAECEAQLRIGGKSSRVRKFFAKYPQIAGKFAVTVTAPEAPAAMPAPAQEKAPEAPAAKPVPAPAPKRGGFELGAL